MSAWLPLSLLRLQMHVGQGRFHSRAVQGNAMGLFECFPSSSAPLSCPAPAVTLVSPQSDSPKAGQLLSVQAFARGSKAWGAQHVLPVLYYPLKWASLSCVSAEQWKETGESISSGMCFWQEGGS